MILGTRSVAVKQLPARLDARGEKRLLRELDQAINAERPAIVLDCSAIGEMDSTAMHLLLCCLESAMKRNGDVRLSGVGARARLNMGLAGVDRLFRIFSTTQEAIESFQRRSAMAPAIAPSMQFAEESAA